MMGMWPGMGLSCIWKVFGVYWCDMASYETRCGAYDLPYVQMWFHEGLAA